MLERNAKREIEHSIVNDNSSLEQQIRSLKSFVTELDKAKTELEVAYDRKCQEADVAQGQLNELTETHANLSQQNISMVQGTSNQITQM